VSSGSILMADGDSLGGVGGASTKLDRVVGASTSSPVDVDDSPMTSTTKMGRRVRATRSYMWKDMGRLY
jgi:hypothetical protein